MEDIGSSSLGRVASTSKVQDEKAMIGCFSHLHPPFLLRIESVLSGTVRRNEFIVKDKCSYAHCKQTDTVAFCGGMDLNYLVSVEVCFLRMADSSYETSYMNLQRIGCCSTFVQGQLMVFGGRTWSESHDVITGPFCRPLILANNFERCKRQEDKVPQWELVEGMGGIPRCYSTAVSISSCAYVIGGYSDPSQLALTPLPRATSSVQVYDRQVDHWMKAPDMHQGRAECGASVLHSFRIFVVGGVNKGVPVGVCEFLDIASQVWTNLKEEPSIPFGPASSCWLGSSLYVAGQMCRDMVKWDSVEEEWKDVFQLPHAYEFIAPITTKDLMRRHST